MLLNPFHQVAPLPVRSHGSQITEAQQFLRRPFCELRQASENVERPVQPRWLRIVQEAEELAAPSAAQQVLNVAVDFTAMSTRAYHHYAALRCHHVFQLAPS